MTHVDTGRETQWVSNSNLF